MLDMHTELIRQLMHNKKYGAVTEFAKIKNNDRDEKIIVSEYAGSEPRLMIRDGEIHILCNKDITYIQETGIADSIANGTIFDDASLLNDQADYMQKTVLPMNAIANKHGVEPKKIRIMITGVMGRINDDGNIEIAVGDIMNGRNFLDDVTSGTGYEHVNKMCDHYLGCDDHESLPLDIRRDISEITKEIDSIADVSPDDEITDEDFETLDLDKPDEDDEEKDEEKDEAFDDDEKEDEDDKTEDKDKDEEDDDDDKEYDESYYEEGFFSKSPKKLKPIPRDVIAYITVEMNNIKDANDQAMLAGYTSNKLEMVDFYLNCLDTQDPRYIVPHNKQYLTQMQSELNQLLQRILQIKPIGKADRIWR